MSALAVLTGPEAAFGVIVVEHCSLAVQNITFFFGTTPSNLASAAYRSRSQRNPITAPLRKVLPGKTGAVDRRKDFPEVCLAGMLK